MLDQEIQQENMVRLRRMNDYRRRKILEKHEQLKEKIAQRRANTDLMQSCAINKALADNDATKNTFELLSKLMKSDPYRRDQRTRLRTTLSSLNSKFGLGVRLEKRTGRGKKPAGEGEEGEQNPAAVHSPTARVTARAIKSS